MKNVGLTDKINSVIPSKIREARIARALSLSELSERIGVSSQAISQYELGTSTPSPVVLMKLINELNFPSTFFYNSSSTDVNYSNGTTYFRSNKSTTKKIKEALKIRIQWIERSRQFILNYVDLPNVDLPNLDDLLDDNELDMPAIEDIANRLRDYWLLGNSPIDNLVDLLQVKGFVISRMDFDNKKVDAFSKWYNGVPYIVLGSDKSSAVRSRFDLAHELGHLIMHRNISEEDLCNKTTLDRIENEAHQFAAAFLLPLSTFNKEVISTSIDHFIILKKRWKTSISMMIKRCEYSDILSDNQIRYLKSQMIKNNYFRREPLDDQIPPEKPYLFKQAFNLLIDNKVITKQALLDSISLDSAEASNLFCLDNDFFKDDKNVVRLSLVKNVQ